MSGISIEIGNDSALNAVLDAVEGRGKRIYLVGGAVRNLLLGEAVGDIDLATDARPEEIMQLATDAGLKPIPTGLDHGTITVVAEGRGFEVTTFRRDVETDGRRAIVAFTDSMEEDARRRDFTMNALYADRAGNVIDPVEGLPDLRARRLRFVGRPEHRIQEDYLRILRFFRFLAWYGQEAEPDAVTACANLKDGLARIAKERIGSEVRKLLAAPDPVATVRLMHSTGVLARILTDPHPDALRALVAIECRENIPPSWPRRLAALVDGHDCSEELRLSKDETRSQSLLARAMAGNWSLDEAGYRLGLAMASDYALIAAAKGRDLPDSWQNQLAHAAAAKLPISARDLQPQLEGPALGRGLQTAESHWIESGFTAPASDLITSALRAGALE